MRLIREMVVHEATSSGTDISCALEVLMRANYRRGIVFVVSDFVDSGFERPPVHDNLGSALLGLLKVMLDFLNGLHGD